MTVRKPIGASSFRVGVWVAHPNARSITQNGTETRLSPRCMNVLVYLAERAGQPVTNDELLATFWRGPISSTNAVHKAIAELREAFGDDPQEPAYIETIPKRGYRLLAAVERLPTSPHARGQNDAGVGGSTVGVVKAPESAHPRRYRPNWVAVGVATTLAIAVAGATAIIPIGKVDERSSPPVAEPESPATAHRTIAVLPFQNIGEATSADQLAARLTVELGQGLGTGLGFAVSDTNASTGHLSGQKGVERIAKDLAVEYVIAGQVSPLQERARLSVSIFGSASDDPLYVFETDLPLVADPQLEGREIARLLDVVGVYTSPDHLETMKYVGTANPEAYLAFMDGDAKRRLQGPRNQESAIPAFRKAAAIDPEFALAYYALAVALIYRGNALPSAGERRDAAVELQALRDQLARLDWLPAKLWHLDDAILMLEDASRETRASRLRVAVAEAEARAPSLSAKFGEAAIQDRYGVYMQFAERLVSARLIEEAEHYLQAAGLPGVSATEGMRARLVALRGNPVLAAQLRKELLQQSPNNVGLLHAQVVNLALGREFTEAEGVLASLELIDTAGLWAYGARLRLAALRGDLPRASSALSGALADPRAGALTRGIVSFTVGDVEGGIAAWRQMDLPARQLAQDSIADIETTLPSEVVGDPRYQALLDEFDMGQRWTAFMRRQAAALAPITGIETATALTASLAID